jgi:nucleoside diphosphate kinase
MQTMVKATFTIIDDDVKTKKTEVIEMVYPMDEDRNFLKSLLEYLEDDSNEDQEASTILTGH